MLIHLQVVYFTFFRLHSWTPPPGVVDREKCVYVLFGNALGLFVSSMLATTIRSFSPIQRLCLVKFKQRKKKTLFYQMFTTHNEPIYERDDMWENALRHWHYNHIKWLWKSLYTPRVYRCRSNIFGLSGGGKRLLRSNTFLWKCVKIIMNFSNACKNHLHFDWRLYFFAHVSNVPGIMRAAVKNTWIFYMNNEFIIVTSLFKLECIFSKKNFS